MTLLTLDTSFAENPKVIQSTISVTSTSTVLADDTQASYTFELTGTRTVLCFYVANSTVSNTNAWEGFSSAINVDGVDYCQMNDSPYNTNYPIRNSTFFVGSLASGQHTIKGRLATNSGTSTITVSNRTLIVIILNGDEAYYTYDSTHAVTSTSNTYVDDSYAAYTGTPSAASNALVLYSVCNTGSSESATGKKICINVAGSSYTACEVSKSPGYLNSCDSLCTSYAVSNLSAQTTFKGQFATATGTSTVSIHRRAFAVLFFDPSVVIDLTSSTNQVTSTSSAFADDNVSISRTSSGALLALVAEEHKNGSTGSNRGTCYGLNIDNSDVALSRSSSTAAYAESNFVAYAQTLPTSKQWIVKGRIAAHTNTYTALVDSRCLIALWFPPPPVAAFTSDVTTGYRPLTVQFTDQSTNTPTSWDWDFGDGTAHGTTQNPSHQYTVAGTYTVVLTATNAGGSDGETKTGYIVVSVSDPYADFAYSTTYPISNTINGYQLKLTIPYATGMNADFSDIRFKNSLDVIIPYYIESKTDSTTATVWIKLTADSTVIMKYGKASATSESNGSNVFDFFEDWSAWNATTWGAQPAWATLSNGILTLTGSGTAYRNLFSSQTFSSGYILESKKQSVSFTGDAANNIGFVEDSFENEILLYQDQYSVIENTAASGTSNYVELPNSDLNYHIVKISWVSSSSVKMSLDGGTQYESTTHIPTGPLNLFMGVYAQTTMNIDWVRVRKYAAVEPSIVTTQIIEMSSTVSGSGAQTANIYEIESISSSVAGSGALTSNVITLEQIASTIAATGLQTANAYELIMITSSISATGNQTANPTLTTYLPLSSLISAVGLQSANAILYNLLSSSVSATGLQTANAFELIMSSSSPSGVGSQTATAYIQKMLSSSISGDGLQTANLITLIQNSSTVSATGSQTANVSQFIILSSSVTAVGAQTANIIKIIPLNSSISATGLQTANPIEYSMLSSNVAGIGLQTANCTTGEAPTIINLSSNVAGVGDQTALANLLQIISSACVGSGEAQATPITLANLSSSIEATGQAQAVVELQQMISSAIEGSGSVTANPVIYKLLSSAIAGVGSSSAHVTFIEIEVPDLEYPLTIAVYQNKWTVAVYQNKWTVDLK